MSVTEAASRLGVGRPALSNLLNGKASLSSTMALRLERAFGADKDDLLRRQGVQDEARHREEAKRVAVRPHVPNLLTIKALDIERWADSREARDLLPVLVRGLVQATGVDLERVDFPGFENSQRPGWDGWVEAGTATVWVPEGRSGWELGTSKRPRQKAECDYSRLLGSLPPEDRERCTFVFVTPRNWSRKNEWAKRKEAANDGWRGVRAYDASDIEQWLEGAVAPPIWLAEALGKTIEGVKTLDAHWKRWAHASKPHMTKHIFNSTIERCMESFQQWLQAAPARPFIVAADSSEEALAFLHCLFQHGGIPVPQRGLPVVFESAEALTKLAPSTAPFIPIAANAETQKRLPEVNERHHCIAICPRNAVRVEPDIALDLLGYDEFKQALESMGITDRHEVSRLAKESGRSPTILRRRLSRIPSIMCPRWAHDEGVARRLIPICLVGAWHMEKDADKEALAKQANYHYEEVEQDVAKLQQVDDCPVWSVGQHRGVGSKIDVLFAVAPLMTEKDVDGFLSLAEYVLSESDPALELPEEDRWAAAIHGKVRKHSAPLREGVCETLVLFAVHGDDLFRNRLGINLEARVSVLIERLLTPLADKLQSLADDLPALAEAAPSKFLSIFEQDLKQDEPAVISLLRPAQHFPFRHDYRTGLLWALERTAWHPESFSRTCMVLAELSMTPINDNLVNKPIASLSSILMPWRPQTAAALDVRMSVLKKIVERFPAVGWQLCMDEVKGGPRFVMNNDRPRWRSDASGAGMSATELECRTYLECAVQMLLSRPRYDLGTLSDLVQHTDVLTDDQQSVVWEKVKAWAKGRNGDDAVAELRNCIRLFLEARGSHIRKATRDAAWHVYGDLEPRSALVRHAWLFENPWVDGSYDREHEDRLRSQAMIEIWDEGGLEGALAMVESGSDGATVGRYIAPLSVETKRVLHECLSRAHNRRALEDLMRAFIGERSIGAESDLLLSVSQEVGPQEAVRIWRCAPFERVTWLMLDGLPEGIRREYWRTVDPYRAFDGEDCTEAAERFFAANRTQAAFVAVRHRLSDVETPTLQRLLLALASEDVVDESAHIGPSSVGSALKELDGRTDITREEMALLEFAFIGATGGQHGIPNLEERLATSPSLFVQALSLRYVRRDGGEDPKEWKIEDEARRRAAAHAAHDLLRQAARIPGTDEDGKVHMMPLLRWLEEARELCAQLGRSIVGDIQIGEYLARAPMDEDGNWPCTAVCEVLERLSSSDIAQGFLIGKRNSRGVVIRTGAGGDQERDLAIKFHRWAASRRADFPFASSVIGEIARCYEDDAKYQDTRAALERRLNGWD